jgi:NADP-dependent 3-hydroxy acid dehydrogenase YdfG
VLPLDLADLRSVNSFAQATLSKVDKVDFLIMNAGLSKASEESGPNGSRWCEALIVNHLCTYPILVFSYTPDSVRPQRSTTLCTSCVRS